MTLKIEGISIPDSKLAREVTDLVRRYRIPAAVQSLQPRLFLRRTRGKQTWAEVRPGTALHWGDVPRHGADPEL